MWYPKQRPFQSTAPRLVRLHSIFCSGYIAKRLDITSNSHRIDRIAAEFQAGHWAIRTNSKAERAMTDLDFTGKNVLVVGGSSGIGNGIAQAFRARGASVTAWGTRASAADYSPEDGSDLDGIAYHQVDVGDPDQIFAAPKPPGELDVLVLSQGIVAYRRAEFERSGWDKVMSVNLNSLIHCSEKFKSDLSSRQGSIIIISSISGLQANIGNPAYEASKAGANSLPKPLGQAYARDGIRVNGIAPGLVDTKLTKVTTENPERLEGALQSIPVRRMGQPEEIAGGVLFLASPLASYVCGQTLCVDGGLSL